jgi:hypothetical protein
MVNYASPFSYYDYSDSGGHGQFFYVPLHSNLVLTPSRIDNQLNGVSTYDLVLISKHILGIESFNSPFKMIAADANKSGSITTFDIIELRKLVLGIYDSLPNNTSWRFVPKEFQFPNVQNPFQTIFPEKVVLQDWTGYPHDFEFTGIKVGDVNNSAIPNATTPPPAESRATSFLTLPDLELKSGEIYEIPIHSALHKRKPSGSKYSTSTGNYFGQMIGIWIRAAIHWRFRLQRCLIPAFISGSYKPEV